MEAVRATDIFMRLRQQRELFTAVGEQLILVALQDRFDLFEPVKLMAVGYGAGPVQPRSGIRPGQVQ